jgi:hypothetical protein
MVWTGPVGQRTNLAGVAMIPPPLAVCPELTADDVAWLNEQMALTDRPPVRYARELPIPPLPSGRRPSGESWFPTRERIR